MTISPEQKAKLKEIFRDPLKRLNALYYIIDKQGRKVKFKCNWAQLEFLNNQHCLNIVLKARQLGISTLMGIFFLDKCLTRSNVSAGIICHTREDAEFFFKRVKYAYDNLPDDIKEARVATVDSARELVLSNGSSIRVGTSMRGSTLNYLHISEFGKICAHYPEKAREIVTGSLNTIATGQFCCIESTAEGREGGFYDMCKQAQDLEEQGKKPTALEYKFFFFPWWKDPTYVLNEPVTVPKEMEDYFAKLKAMGITLTDPQRWWYVAKEKTQQDDMKREYPSYPEESFMSAIDGAYYGRQLQLARMEGRITKVQHDPELPVHTAWDLGYADDTSIWLFQMDGKEINLIEFIEGSNEPLTHYLKILKSKGYIYGKHLVPHDAKVHEYSSGLTRIQIARKLGFDLTVSTELGLHEGIDACRHIFNRCWFDEAKCAKGVAHLSNYKRAWNATHGCWASFPQHNAASHGADSFRTLACGLDKLTTELMTDQYAERLLDMYQPRFT